ncbi:MAG: outer membrane lipoprotein-sorting protein [Candidatus Aminicenantes bacterium]|nr:outer membrane lipoprotein-sorting protein [Candidatus Aminicenantes bacterium]
MRFNQNKQRLELSSLKLKENSPKNYNSKGNNLIRYCQLCLNWFYWLSRHCVFILFLLLIWSYGILKSEGNNLAILSQFDLTAQKILKKVDENFTSETKIIMARMIIHGRRVSRSLEFKSYIQGNEKGFTEFLAPPREKGTKMLKLGDQLWSYTPATDRVILISGHMLRQSVMGSDLSYEDMMEDQQLLEAYEPEIVGEEKMLSADCWVLSLKAKKADIAYPSRKIWVDKEKFLVLKEERYARSGALLKRAEVKKVGQFQKRWVPVEAVYKDVLKEGQGTEFIIEDIQFDVPIPEYIFTKAALK